MISLYDLFRVVTDFEVKLVMHQGSSALRVDVVTEFPRWCAK